MMKKSLELKYLEVLNNRQMLNTENVKNRYYKLILGYEGEREVYIWVKKYGSEDWLIFYDLWFEMGNGTQADFVVVSDTTWFLLEVKNYDGHFRYEQGVCWLNDFQFKDNVMSRMDQRVLKLQLIADELKSGIKVVGAMIFVNEHCSVQVDQALNFDIVTRSGLKKYLTQMKYANSGKLSAEYVELSRSLIAKYTGESPFKPMALDFDAFDEVPKGITCEHCHSFHTKVRHQSVLCHSCGVTESKTAAIIRSAKQLSLLYFDKPNVVTRKNLFEFMGGKVSGVSIYKALSKNFEMKGAGNAYYYRIDN